MWPSKISGYFSATGTMFSALGNDSLPFFFGVRSGSISKPSEAILASVLRIERRQSVNGKPSGIIPAWRQTFWLSSVLSVSAAHQMTSGMRVPLRMTST